MHDQITPSWGPVVTFEEDAIGPYMIEQWPDGVQVETYWSAPIDARELDEGRAWVATLDIDGDWLEDSNLFADIMASVNARETDAAGGYSEDSLIYNELILRPQRSEYEYAMEKYRERYATLDLLTKPQLMEIVTSRNLDHVIKQRMLKKQIIDTLINLTN